MAQFSFKGESFPYFPKEIRISGQKRLARLSLAFGGTAVQQLGWEPLEITGTGELTGELGGEFDRLYQLFSQPDSGILQLPGFSPLPCFFTALEGVGQPGPAVLEYRFSFLEDTAYTGSLTQQGSTVVAAQGDTLYTLAQRLGIDAAALIAANPGVDPLAPERGQVLCLP